MKGKKEIGKIIAPVDGSEGAKRAAKQALLLAQQTGKKVVALYVVDTPYLTETIPPDEISTHWGKILSDKGQKILDDVEQMGKEMDVRVEKKLIEGIPDDVIINEAKRDDLIVMGCKGTSAMDRILLGSVCEKVSHHSKSQVLLVR
jgi:nucleotide-binding universal stress UspA family protein